MSKLESKEELLKESLCKLNSQISAYQDVLRLKYPLAIPMMQVLQDMSRECLDLITSSTVDNPLSKREREVLTQVSKGLLNKEIAFILGISCRTVEFHLKSIFNKTKTTRRTEASVKAIKSGWIIS